MRAMRRTLGRTVLPAVARSPLLARNNLQLSAALRSFSSSHILRADVVTTSAAAPTAVPGVASAVDAAAPVAAIASNGTYPDFSIVTSTLGSGGYWDRAMSIVEQVHTQFGVEWWVAIVAVSLALRAATVPLFLRSVKTGAWLQHHNETLLKFNDSMLHARKSGNPDELRRVWADRKAFMDKHNLKFRYILLPALAQMPLFITLFTVLRTYAREAHLIPGFASGGTAWFTALHLPDPTGTLPILSACLSIASIAANNNMQGIPQLDLTPGGQRVLFGSLSAFFSVATLWMPASVQLYITITSGTMLLQQALLRVKPLRAAIGFPDGWPIPPEVFAERTRKRLAEGGEELNPAVSSLTGFKGLLGFMSRVAEGKFTREPRHVYVSVSGLRDPGAPPAPATAPPQLSVAQVQAVAGSTASIASSGPVAAAAASAAAIPTPSGTTAGTVGSVGTGVLLANKPSKKHTGPSSGKR